MMDDRDQKPKDAPLVAPAYINRMRQLVAAEIARDGGTYYDRKYLEGWRRELERLERGEVY